METQLKILLLAANSGARVEREFREIKRRLNSSSHRKNFSVEIALGVRPSDFSEVLLRHTPNILHFSGRSDKKTGLLLADDSASHRPVLNKALTRLLEILKDNLDVLVFNAGYTRRQAQGLSKTFDYTIGMKEELDDESAINFSASFYQALGFGRTVKEAFDLACNRLQMENRGASKAPFLLCRSGVDTSLPLVLKATYQTGTLGQIASKDPLSIPKRTWDANFSPPAALLRAEFGIVPFYGRIEELETLSTWLNDSAPVGVMLVTGRGGSGKTRLAIKTCRFAKEQDYHAGFFSFSTTSSSPVLLFHSRKEPKLVVIDYAETQRAELPGLIEAMIVAGQNGHPPLRLLLLARGAGDWWTELRTTPSVVSELLQSEARKRLRLGSVTKDEVGTYTTYQQALKAFADELNYSHDITDDKPTIESGREILVTHAQALLKVLGDGETPNDEFQVFEFLLNRERRFWNRQLAARHVDTTFLPVFEKMVAAVTLQQGLSDTAHLDRLVGRVQDTHRLETVTTMKLRSVMLDTYGNGTGIDPLQPDPLGEHLLTHHLTREIEDLASL